MAPTVYRAFHFEHHRHTQDPQKDPELMTASSQPARWPRSLKGWLMMAPGMGLTIWKGSILVRFSFLPYAQWEERAPWVPPIEQRPRLAWAGFLLPLSSVTSSKRCGSQRSTPACRTKGLFWPEREQCSPRP
jgi:fatty acid desaturase